MPNGFLPTICRLIWPVDPIPTRRRGQARAEGSPSRREASGRRKRGNKRACARRPGKRACEVPAKNQAPSDWGGDSAPDGALDRPHGESGWRARIRALLRRGGEEERNGAETWKRRLSDFVGSAAGPSERRGEVGAGEKSREKKGEKKYGGPDGAKRKKNGRPSPALCGARGQKKKPSGFFFFLRFASAPRGA